LTVIPLSVDTFVDLVTLWRLIEMKTSFLPHFFEQNNLTVAPVNRTINRIDLIFERENKVEDEVVFTR